MKPGLMNILVFPLLLFVLVFLLCACGGTEYTEEFFQSYQVRSGTVVSIDNPNGNVEIIGWDGDEVEISAVKVSYNGTDALEEVDIYIDITDILKIRTEHPEGEMRTTVSYSIKVPHDVMIGLIECANGNITIEDVGGNPSLFTSNGTINVNSVNGVVKAYSSNGDIEVTGIRGLANLRTSNGNITAELPLLHENVDIRTSNGSINLLLAPELDAVIEAQTSNGEISVANLNLDELEKEQTYLSGILNDGDYNIHIETSNGSIGLAQLQ